MSKKLDLNQTADAESLPRPYPSGAWDRSDYVREYAKLERELEAMRSQFEQLLDTEDTYGNTASTMHPRMTRGISAARKFLSENKG